MRGSRTSFLAIRNSPNESAGARPARLEAAPKIKTSKATVKNRKDPVPSDVPYRVDDAMRMILRFQAALLILVLIIVSASQSDAQPMRRIRGQNVQPAFKGWE